MVAIKRPNNKDFQPEIEILGSPYSQLPSKVSVGFQYNVGPAWKKDFCFLVDLPSRPWTAYQHNHGEPHILPYFSDPGIPGIRSMGPNVTHSVMFR